MQWAMSSSPNGISFPCKYEVDGEVMSLIPQFKKSEIICNGIYLSLHIYYKVYWLTLVYCNDNEGLLFPQWI
jgi:hypothetical protein